jgi:prevent-host-death family protein
VTQVNMLEAKTNLSKLVEAVESGKETEIVLARNGKPVARLVPIGKVDTSKRLGIAEGQFGVLDEEWFKEWQALDEVVWRGFYENPAKFPPPKPRRRRVAK